ncbi:hypothetical protein VTL71DRAFT_15101 [Oculimacula yallundae]|uniref:Uncharacterized protein n=1 Tax=Oculimacula yallundae TaxID=86028 RepID=A0ABR4CFL8_9HELO
MSAHFRKPPVPQPKSSPFNSRINRYGRYNPSSYIDSDQHHEYTSPGPRPKTPTFNSRINRHGYYDPTSYSAPEQQHHLTPSEMLIMIFALGILVALVSWLVWILVEFCITFVKEKVDDMDVGKRLRDDRHRAEETPKKAIKTGLVLGRMGLGGLAEIGGRIFGKKDEGRRLDEEWRGLLGGEGEGVESGGYGVFDERQGYGYHEGMIYPTSSSSAPNKMKYADGASESSGCVGPMYGHREECVGDCTMQTRRRSREDPVESA